MHTDNEVTQMSIFLDVMKEELERNLYKQQAFQNELNSFKVNALIFVGRKSFAFEETMI